MVSHITVPSVHSCESLRSLDGPDEPVPELLVALVRGEVEAVEARMGAREGVGVAPLLDGEQLRTVAAVQLLKPVHWNAGSTGHELLGR